MSLSSRDMVVKLCGSVGGVEEDAMVAVGLGYFVERRQDRQRRSASALVVHEDGGLVIRRASWKDREEL